MGRCLTSCGAVLIGAPGASRVVFIPRTSVKPAANISVELVG